MQNLLNSQPFPSLIRSRQLTVAHCGPASVQMLLSFLGHEVDQNQIVQSANASDKLLTHGTTLNDFSLAINNLFPQLQFWYKYNASMADLSAIINDFQYPVGVEWQGVFDYPDDEEEDVTDYGEEDDDPGHYGVITYINTLENILLIADPERHYAGTDRRFSILQFERRWWDINEITDPQTFKKQEVDDYHAMFIITPKDVTFPDQLHMIKG